MAWYGWIPILTSSLFYKKFFDDKSSDAIFIDDCNVILQSDFSQDLNPNLIQQIRDKLALPEDQKIYKEAYLYI